MTDNINDKSVDGNDGKIGCGAAQAPGLNLPWTEVKTRRHASDNRVEIFDRWRRRWVALTPEEWVRQHFAAMLVDRLGYLSGRIANEVSIELNDTHRRCDTVVYADDMSPLMVVEYKATDVPLTQAVFDQIVRYNMVLHAPFLAVSNGRSHYCCRIDFDTHTYTFLPGIPPYAAIKNLGE